MSRAVRTALFASILAALLPAAMGAASTTHAPQRLRLTEVSGGVPGPITGAAARAIHSGPLAADPAALAAAKARAASAAPARTATQAPRAPSPAPTTVLSKPGVFDPNFSPSDSTGAIGRTRYIETVNSMVRIYDRTLTSIATDTLESWWGEPGANVFDPQVIWDPTTNRFYYAGDAVFSDTDNRLAFGFSTTSSPNNATTDWCHYEISYGAEFPDFPKLGDSKHFVIIGVNVFTTSFLRSDILAVGKPPAGTACPDASTFAFGVGADPKVGAVQQFTPVPANEIDTNATGWVLTRSAPLPATRIGLFSVTRDPGTGLPVIQTSGAPITVPSYAAPPNAPQLDGNFLLDTSDARLTQAVAAVDPARAGLAIWTQHAVAGGAGAMERWYEINPVAGTVLQMGTVKHAALYVFNGAVSPDRVVRGATRAFGSNMILGYTTSSSATYPAIRMVGKRGTSGVSSPVLVKSSPGHDEDFACSVGNGSCRWGDYSAATPDPGSATTRATGTVWLTNMWTADADTTGGTAGTSWRTWNWVARP